MRHIGLAFDLGLLDARAIGRAVAALGAFRSRAVNLHKLRIIHVGAERAFNRFQIGFVAV